MRRLKKLFSQLFIDRHDSGLPESVKSPRYICFDDASYRLLIQKGYRYLLMRGILRVELDNGQGYCYAYVVKPVWDPEDTEYSGRWVEPVYSQEVEILLNSEADVLKLVEWEG